MTEQFTMSMYKSKEDLYKAKAEYYEKQFRMLAYRLVEGEVLGYDVERDTYYCWSSGEDL